MSIKKLIPLAASVALLVPSLAFAAINVSVGPTALVTSPITAKASSGQIGLFSFTIAQTAAETLSSVAVTINNNGGSTATGADFASVSVYKDNGNGIFEPGVDALAGTQTTVNVGSATTVTTSSNNTIDVAGSKFFLSLATGASWSSTNVPPDSVTATFGTGGIVTSANSPTVVLATTSTITADSVAPTITTAVAQNTGGTAAKEAGDSVVLTFSQATNMPAITSGNINTVLALNNSHSWLDGAGAIGSAVWSGGGTLLTITLSAGTSIPTVATGDMVTVGGSLIMDAAGNNASGAAGITGSFATIDTTGPMLTSATAKNTGGTSAKEAGDSVDVVFNESTNKATVDATNIATVLALNNSHSWLDGAGAIGGTSWSVDGKTLTVTLSAGTSIPTVAVGDTVTASGSVIKDLTGNSATGSQTITGNFAGSISSGDEDENDNDEGEHHMCTNTLINGHLYTVGTDKTVYLAAACRLKPFRGEAVFHARGHKFQNITNLPTLPANVTISDHPVLPANGTLVKGSDKTVWFVDSHGHKRGFINAVIFAALGFNFKNTETISDSDLGQIPAGNNIDNPNQHPDGAIIKCSNSGTVSQVEAGMTFPFANAQAFIDRGHTFTQVLNVSCQVFLYTNGASVSK